jgi:hypothetical protein
MSNIVRAEGADPDDLTSAGERRTIATEPDEPDGDSVRFTVVPIKEIAPGFQSSSPEAALDRSLGARPTTGELGREDAPDSDKPSAQFATHTAAQPHPAIDAKALQSPQEPARATIEEELSASENKMIELTAKGNGLSHAGLGGSPSSPEEMSEGVIVLSANGAVPGSISSVPTLVPLPTALGPAMAMKSVDANGQTAVVVRQDGPAQGAAKLLGRGGEIHKPTAGVPIDGAVYLATEVNGVDVGELPFRVGPDKRAWLHLGGLLSVFESSIDPSEFARLSSSASASQYVSVDTLRAAGIDVRYDSTMDRLQLKLAPQKR